MPLPVLFALLTGLFWGAYGPTLAVARGAEGSPFKPYVMIGAAYLVWGILGGLIGMKVKGDAFVFSRDGIIWGFAAGSLGAWGALTLTLAIFNGGFKYPQVVMAIVFGSAVVVTALISLWTAHGSASPMLWVGIAGVAISSIIVALNTPHAGPAHKPAPAAVTSAPTAAASLSGATPLSPHEAPNS